MPSDQVNFPAARAADSPKRAEAPATGRHPPPARLAASPRRLATAARPSQPGGYRGAGPGLLAPAPGMVARGERLRERVRATPPCARPDPESFLPHLPEVLAGLFDGVELTFASGALRCYAVRAEDLGATVRVASTGRWHTADGTAEGHGAVALAMWRVDVGTTEAVVVLRALVAPDHPAPVPAGGGA